MTDDAKQWLRKFLELRSPGVAEQKPQFFEQFAADADQLALAQQILALQHMIQEKWRLQNRVDDIMRLHLPIPNGMSGKPYSAHLPFLTLGLDDVVAFEFEGIEALGLVFDEQEEKIIGTPNQAGDFTLNFKFRVIGEAEDAAWNVKKMTLVINHNPKSLWKNLPSDPQGRFAKADDAHDMGRLGEKHLVVASRRGRSHANTGTYRDDDYAFCHLADSGWSAVAMADGAGSASAARKGSELATAAVVDWVMHHGDLTHLTQKISERQSETNEESTKNLNLAIYDVLSQIARFAHKCIHACAESEGLALSDFHTTLIFALFKKFDFGYAVLAFSVGDCPVALLNADQSELTLLNKLDVGEFGGGTRFITMPEIFNPEKLHNRFRFKLVQDFSHLFLMTDGIYDPKFEVEAKLEKLESWQAFLDDLKGNNADKAAVDFDPENTEMGAQLAQWMDFWSPGNHDDRTLAIIF